MFTCLWNPHYRNPPDVISCAGFRVWHDRYIFYSAEDAQIAYINFQRREIKNYITFNFPNQLRVTNDDLQSVGRWRKQRKGVLRGMVLKWIFLRLYIYIPGSWFLQHTNTVCLEFNFKTGCDKLDRLNNHTWIPSKSIYMYIYIL